MEENKKRRVLDDEELFLLNRFQKYQEESEKRTFYSNQRLDTLIYGICIAVLAFNVNFLLNNIEKSDLSVLVKILLIISSVLSLIALGANLFSQITSREINQISSRIADKEILDILGEDTEADVIKLQQEQEPKIKRNDKLNYYSLIGSIFSVILAVLAVSLFVFTCV